jgi:hypothetical protein
MFSEAADPSREKLGIESAQQHRRDLRISYTALLERSKDTPDADEFRVQKATYEFHLNVIDSMFDSIGNVIISLRCNVIESGNGVYNHSDMEMVALKIQSDLESIFMLYSLNFTDIRGFKAVTSLECLRLDDDLRVAGEYQRSACRELSTDRKTAARNEVLISLDQTLEKVLKFRARLGILLNQAFVCNERIARFLEDPVAATADPVPDALEESTHICGVTEVSAAASAVAPRDGDHEEQHPVDGSPTMMVFKFDSQGSTGLRDLLGSPRRGRSAVLEAVDQEEQASKIKEADAADPQVARTEEQTDDVDTADTVAIQAAAQAPRAARLSPR